MNYTSYLIRRLLYMVVTVVAISAAIFLVIQLPPGDAVDAIVAEREAQGDVITEEDERDLRHLYGLDRPMVVQYADWAIRFLTGNMGRSKLGHAAAGGAERDQHRHLPVAADPALFVVVTVLLYNFMGDGLRDAADPYAMSGRG